MARIQVEELGGEQRRLAVYRDTLPSMVGRGMKSLPTAFKGAQFSAIAGQLEVFGLALRGRYVCDWTRPSTRRP